MSITQETNPSKNIEFTCLNSLKVINPREMKTICRLEYPTEWAKFIPYTTLVIVDASSGQANRCIVGIQLKSYRTEFSHVWPTNISDSAECKYQDDKHPPAARILIH